MYMYMYVPFPGRKKPWTIIHGFHKFPVIRDGGCHIHVQVYTGPVLLSLFQPPVCFPSPRLAKVSSSRQQDQSLITDLEKHLKHETESRSRAEANLREHRNLVRHSWSEEEVKEFKDKLLAKERELESVRKDLHKKERAFDNLSKELAAKRSAVRGLEEELKQMKASLADETRVKIELFTALSEARRKHQEELRIKSAEINKLRQNLAEIIAIMPVPTTSSGSVLGGGATLPFSSSATTPTSSPQQQQLH